MIQNHMVTGHLGPHPHDHDQRTPSKYDVADAIEEAVDGLMKATTAGDELEEYLAENLLVMAVVAARRKEDDTPIELIEKAATKMVNGWTPERWCSWFDKRAR